MLFSVLQVVLVLILVILILVQPPSTGSLSSFNNSQQSISSQRSSVLSMISKVTIVVACLFIVNTLILSCLYSQKIHKVSIAEKIELEKKADKYDVPFDIK
ncbi:preprotein translocase subunit SecG [Wolbachia endosymbiont of Pentidionis agamae]|uniref:preprotein translocase subunit SecG n=1 Tax=Wolbachia endosymbiont of Pentidionis agamae TaxID=3110435 RepID=UPI002FCF25CF